jgi:hypothetical protein
LPKLSLTLIRRLIAEGDVLVNGATSLKGIRLQTDDQVAVKLFAAEKSAATPEPIPLDILFEDEHLIVINKPTGLLVHPSNSEKSGTLVERLWPTTFWEKTWRAAAPRPGASFRIATRPVSSWSPKRRARIARCQNIFANAGSRSFISRLVSGVVEKNSGED